VQNLSQRAVFGYSGICKSLVEAGNRTAIHFVVLPVSTVHLYDGGLVTIGVRVCAGSAECFGPVSGESLDMLRVEAVAERMPDHGVGHHPTMPGVGKTAQAVHSARRLEDSLHATIVTNVPFQCNKMAARRGVVGAIAILQQLFLIRMKVLVDWGILRRPALRSLYPRIAVLNVAQTFVCLPAENDCLLVCWNRYISDSVTMDKAAGPPPTPSTIPGLSGCPAFFSEGAGISTFSIA
jgi:hypothetical protein